MAAMPSTMGAMLSVVKLMTAFLAASSWDVMDLRPSSASSFTLRYAASVALQYL